MRRIARTIRRLAAGLTAAALLAGCSSAVAPSSTVPSASEAPQMDTGQPWDLVWFSDSSGFGLADLWAGRIEEEVGVEVRVHDFSRGAAGGSVLRILDRIEAESEVRDALAAAEVIGLYANPTGTKDDDELLSICVSTGPSPRDPPTVSAVTDFEAYRGALRSLYDRISELRAGAPTIIRAVDLYNPLIGPWRAAGIEPECTAGWEAMATAVREVAAEYGVPTASMYDAFNGPDHDQDPVEKGYIGADGEHTSEAGRAAQVDVLEALGLRTSVLPSIVPPTIAPSPTDAPVAQFSAYAGGPPGDPNLEASLPDAVGDHALQKWSLGGEAIALSAWIFDIAERAGVPPTSYAVAYAVRPTRLASADRYEEEGRQSVRVHALQFGGGQPEDVLAAFQASYEAAFLGDDWASTTCEKVAVRSRSVLWCHFDGWGPWFNWYAYAHGSTLYLIEGAGEQRGPGEQGGLAGDIVEMLP